MTQVESLVDVAAGLQRGAIYQSPELYQLELERVFARCWLFLAHESELPKAGDFVRRTMGEDEVIVIRQRDSSIKAFLNACRHRGAQVCPAEGGTARNFTCNYHGWTYGIDGKLLVVPLEEQVYRTRIDKAAHGLRQVPGLENFHGFIFGCFDPAAPTLTEYLGDMAWWLETWMDSTGGVELVGPPSRSFMRCNWKIPAENFAADGYHAGWTHGGAFQALGAKKHRVGNSTLYTDGPGVQATTRHGHGVGVGFDNASGILGETGPLMTAWQAERRGQIEKRVGALRARFYNYHTNGTIFPNASYIWGTNTFKLWAPRGADSVEVMTWAIVEKEMPQELKDAIAMASLRAFGTAGMLETDDADNMESITLLNRGYMIRQNVINAQMGMGLEREDPEMPGVVNDCAMAETGHRGFYRFWQELLTAPDWDAVRKGDEAWKEVLLGAVHEQPAERELATGEAA